MQNEVKQLQEDLKPLERLIEELKKEKFVKERYLSLLQEEYEKLEDKSTTSTHPWRMEMLKTETIISKLRYELEGLNGSGKRIEFIKKDLILCQSHFEEDEKKFFSLTQDKILKFKKQIPETHQKLEAFYKEITKEENK